MELSIIIVPYKCKDKLDVTLEAVYQSRVNFNYEVIVIDNDSQDGSVEMVREKYLSDPDKNAKTILIENENVGFGKANNQGMKMAKGEYILLLNPDTKVEPDNLQIMMDFMKSRPDVGISTCRLVKDDGTIDAASRRSEPDPKAAFYRLSGLQFLFPKKFGVYNALDKDPSQSHELDACVGAYMFMSRACYEKTQGFDERYFMYGEDLDLCRKAREAGFKVWWHPATTCIHYKGQSSGKAPQRSLYAFHDAMWIYYDKWYRKQYNFLMDGFVYAGIWGRYYWKSFRNMLRKKKYVSK
jgi:GT2 family glycosyltransferase